MKKLAQTMITRLPYAEQYDVRQFLEATKQVEERALISVAIPVHVDNPFGAMKFIADAVAGGLTLAAVAVWQRDRHIVVTRSSRLTNMWEPVAIFSRSADYVINKDSVRKIKKGFEGKENTFDADEFLCCIGDLWNIRNDRRDRRFLPGNLVLNCAQLADIKPGDTVLDPWGNPGVRDTCATLGWKYVDLGHPNAARSVKKALPNGANE